MEVASDAALVSAANALRSRIAADTDTGFVNGIGLRLLMAFLSRAL
jgi:hypothetical protein